MVMNTDNMFLRSGTQIVKLKNFHKVTWISIMPCPIKNKSKNPRNFHGTLYFLEHFYIHCFKLYEFYKCSQSCPTLCDPMDTRLHRPWDFLSKSTGVGCHFLLQYAYVISHICLYEFL